MTTRGRPPVEGSTYRLSPAAVSPPVEQKVRRLRLISRTSYLDGEPPGARRRRDTGAVLGHAWESGGDRIGGCES